MIQRLLPTGIRTRLLLVSLLLMLIPVIGFRFIQQMEQSLRTGQQQVLAGSARLLSATLSDRPALFKPSAQDISPDEAERSRILSLFSSDDPATAANLGSAYDRSEGIEQTLQVVTQPAERIWVVDASLHVRGLSGSLRRPQDGTDEATMLQKTYRGLLRPLLRMAAGDPYEPIADNADATYQAVMRQVDKALQGQANSLTRIAGAGSNGALILSAAQPIWQGDSIIGAVVMEETTQGNQAITYAATESLLAMSAIIVIVGFLTLVVFASRLAFRVRRLQREAAGAIDAQGRISRSSEPISGTGAHDEIGALAQTLDVTLSRLRQYNAYLEQMAGRLSHELRTPLAVVRSSLDNLRQTKLPEDSRVYVQRADEGIARLATLITRMSAATQLERMLQEADMEVFDFREVVSGCVEGYRLAYAPRVFEHAKEADPIMLSGVPDALAQMLDKLVQNAVDFAPADTAITIALQKVRNEIELRVTNKGPLLPASAGESMFASMVSIRQEGDSREGHLGLGLYLVRLIADFHGGRVSAANLADGSGVQFVIAFPVAKIGK